MTCIVILYIGAAEFTKRLFFAKYSKWRKVRPLSLFRRWLHTPSSWPLVLLSNECIRARNRCLAP